jgi:DNA polymerase-3 subunit delta'
MFANIVGNETSIGYIKRLLANGRVPGALLFAGPDGVGKKQAAFELARAFVCRSPVGVEACGSCPACGRVGKFVLPTSDKGDDFDRVFFSDHSDVGLVVPFKRNLRVGSIRALEREAHFRPYEAEARVFIIDDAHKMNDNAANALLKTLEEPPPTTYIVLVTSQPDALLSTIRSRCQSIIFSPVPSDEIEAYLVGNHAHSAADSTLAARLAGGSLGRAVTLDLAKYKDQRNVMLGVIRAALVSNDRASMLSAAERMNDAKNKDDLEAALSILETLIRDIWLLVNGADRTRLSNSDIVESLDGLAVEATSLRLAFWLSEIEDMRRAFAVNINRKIATDALFVKMAA